MAQEAEEGLSALLARFPVYVTYVPRTTEVDFNELYQLPESADVYEIRPNAALDPAAEALHAREIAQERTVAILIPGRRFDSIGTRHGKGAGWYDRFLAQVPTSWTRIGFCFEDQFSEGALIRESWDEPMDYVVVQKNGDISLYKTGARTAML